MSVTIQIRRDTAANWTSANPTLAAGEIGFVTDTGQMKIGNGSTAWNSLSYISLTGAQSSILLTATSDPATPSAGTQYIYSKDIGGRLMPKMKGPSGVDTPIQPAIFSNGVRLVSPGTTTALNYVGMGAFTAVGTLSHPALTANSLRESTIRGIVTSAATANSASELRYAIAQAWRGNSGNLGGFFAVFRFGISSTVATQQVFVGFTSSTSAIATTQVPSALTLCVGVGWDNADSNMQLLHNDGSGTCTKVDLGASFVKNQQNDFYELVLFAKPSDTAIGWRVKNLRTDVETSGTIASSDIPTTTTFLAPHIYANNGGTAAAVILDFYRYYLETDF